MRLTCRQLRAYAVGMTIPEYLKTKNMSAAEFGRHVGATRSAVCCWLSGRRVPGRVFALRIVHLTEGAVALDDIYGSPRGKHGSA